MDRIADHLIAALQCRRAIEIWPILWGFLSEAGAPADWALLRTTNSGKLLKFEGPTGLFRVLSAGEAELLCTPGAVSSGASGGKKVYIAMGDDGPSSGWAWIVDQRLEPLANSMKKSLDALLLRVADVEEGESVRRRESELSAVLHLEHDLSDETEPGALARIVSDVTHKALRCDAVCVLLFSGDEAALTRSLNLAPEEPVNVSGGGWLGLARDMPVRWESSDTVASRFAKLSAMPPMRGIAHRAGTPNSPLALVAAMGRKESFGVEDQVLLEGIIGLFFSRVARLEKSAAESKKATEVTELLRLLSSEKERLSLILRSVPVGLMQLGSSGVITFANEAAQKALGITQVELEEHKIFGGRQSGKVIMGLVEKAREQRDWVSTPYEMEGRWYQVRVAPLPDIGQFLFVTEDIQDWFQIGRLKEDLISIISHELKNPLTSIINAAELLKGERAGKLNSSQQRMAGLINDDARSIRVLLDDVVRLSKIHHLGGDLAQVELKGVVEKILQAISDTLQGKQIELVSDLQEVTVTGEPLMLENMVANLVGNSVKYTGFGGRIGVRLRAESGVVRIRVCDDGPGIPREELDRIGMPFFRASNVREQVSGTGLGLVIVKNVVERMRGRLTADSPISETDRSFLGCEHATHVGSVFEVEMPLA